MVGDCDQRRRQPVLVEAARGVGEEQRFAAERAEGLDRDRHGARIAALVIMAAALEEGDPSAFDLADDEPPGVAFDGRDRKAGDVDIGNRDRVARFIGESAEARAEHDCERRQRGKAAGFKSLDCGVCVGGHGFLA